MDNKGWKCIFEKDDEIPLIIKKSDGGYTYAATDMTAIKYRFNELGVDESIYITDVGQRDHFTKIFNAAKFSGFYDSSKQTPTHIGLGLIKGEDGKKMKSRSGKSVKLHELLDEAVERAHNLLKERVKDPKVSSYLVDQDLSRIAQTIGMNSIKYYDLKQNPESTYKFSFDNMLDTKGNTGMYVTYMYVRVISILRKAFDNIDDISKIDEQVKDHLSTTQFSIKSMTPEEFNLAITILRLPECIDDSITNYQLSSKICDNLYDLSVKFSEFYQNCQVIGHDELMPRLMLVYATKLSMEKHFHLLGLQTIECI